MIRHQIVDKDLILHLDNKRIDVITAPLLRKQIQDMLDSTKLDNIILDLSTVEFIDSAGLVCLLALWKALRKKNGDLKIASPQLAVQQTIELVLLNKVFAIYPSINDAREKALTK